MYFYLLNNSTLIVEKNEETRNIKTFVYGSLTYIVTHAILFIGGEESLLYPLKSYFWLLLILDCIVCYILYFNKKGPKINSNIMTNIFNKNNKYLHSASESNNRIPQRMPELESFKRKKVQFQIPTQNNLASNESDSESMGSDIDMDMFEKSL